MSEANVDRFSGGDYTNIYDSARPKPPPALRDIIYQLVTHKPRTSNSKVNRVADLGCGTGLSTYFWANHAEEVFGIEPNADMIAKAKSHASKLSGNTKFSFIQNISSSTGLPDNSIDVVTCSQSLHWMEPDSTFKEVARILKPGGVFVAYDCDWPPTVLDWRAEKMYQEFQKNVKAAADSRGLFKDVKKWKKGEHLERMRASGLFSYVKEIVVNHEELGNCDRAVAVAESQGSVSTAKKAGISMEEMGLNELKRIAEETLGKEMTPWYWSYYVRFGIK